MKEGSAKALLSAHGLSPKRSFGQNFLVSESALLAIAKACVEDGETATVVEIGAGLGALTRALLGRAPRVVAVERDRDLIPLLEQAFADPIAEGRLEVVEDDAQTFSFAARFSGARLRVLAGNLPYQITGRLLSRATEEATHFDRAVFMIQKEVASRLVAKPSTADYGALSVFVQARFQVEALFSVPPSAFFPAPQVTSSVVRLTPLNPPRAQETPCFRALVRAAFAQRRKTLRNAWKTLAPSPALEEAATRADVALSRRGETLSVEEFRAMEQALEACAG